MFSVLGCLWFLANRKSPQRAFWLGIGATLLLGVVIECSQVYLPPLIADASDVGIYALGYSMGFASLVAIFANAKVSELPLPTVAGFFAKQTSWSIARSTCNGRGGIHSPVGLGTGNLSIASSFTRRIARHIRLFFVPLVALWIYAIPMSLAVVNAMPWTGWIWWNEADLFVLTDDLVLTWRTKWHREDFLQWNIASVAILLLGIANAFGILLALHASTAQDWLTANPYLHPLNAFRASHGFWLALALLPFLNAETRVHSNTTKHFLFSMTLTLLCRLFGWRFGTRSFPGLWNLNSDYRIVGTWFDMHLGGSQIGIFLAMAIPCAIVSVFHSNTWFKGISILTLVLAGYCLVACFARAALGITALAIVLLVLLGSLSLLHRVHRPRASLLLGSGVLFVLVGGITLFVGVRSTFLRSVFELYLRIGMFDIRLGSRRSLHSLGGNGSLGKEVVSFHGPSWMATHGSSCPPITF